MIFRICLFSLCCFLNAEAIIQTSSILPVEYELEKFDSSCLVMIQADVMIMFEAKFMQNTKILKRNFNKLLKDGKIKKEDFLKLPMKMILSDIKWKKLIQRLEDKEVTVIAFDLGKKFNTTKQLPACAINIKDVLLLNSAEQLKVKFEKYEKVIVIGVNRKMLEQIESLDKKVVAIEYTHLANLPCLPDNIVQEAILKACK